MDIKITPVCGCPWLVIFTGPLNERIRLLICVQLRLLMFNTGACALWEEKSAFVLLIKKGFGSAATTPWRIC